MPLGAPRPAAPRASHLLLLLAALNLPGPGAAAPDAAPGPGRVAATDPLGTPACAAARRELDAARAALSPPGPSPAQGRRVEAARSAAARICLGEGATARPGAGDSPSGAAGRGARAPWTPALPPPPVPVLSGTGNAAPALLPAPAPPPVLTACDAAGCWDSSGRRLERAGPLLLSPQGPCTAAAGRLDCP